MTAGIWTGQGKLSRKKCPEYKEAFRRVLDRKGAHMFNMFIMKDDLFQAYCSWLFPILEELEGYGMKINEVSDEARQEMADVAQPAAIESVAADIGQEKVDAYLADGKPVLSEIS